ncbi:hypothetical protein LUZ61_009637 [Rhynchospora tenuis]|uniref:F-box domain-containing protein n=1 Tax=Rhynchospora tenuis TaxID=198213 RepID=A0AAD5ZXK6_9POAL|nr:hypothetical protein LUZ61_009637 [Rhynchospora tenuis]
MNYLPEGVVQQILSQLKNARDVASSTCVSKQWQSCVPYIPSLFFSRAAFDYLPRGNHQRSDYDATIGRMIEAAIRLEELVIYCPFNPSNLGKWLSLRANTLRVLELRMDGFGDKPGPDGTGTQLDCICVAKQLEQLKIWGVSLTTAPKWGVLKKLKNLEIVGATLRDGVLEEAVHAFPNLVSLVLLSCDGVGLVKFELERLERCRLDFLGHGSIALFLSMPRLEELHVQGFSSIWVKPNHRLRTLSIAKTHGRVYSVEMGKLAEVESLYLRGIQWSWSAISSVLQNASDIIQLTMKVEFCGNSETLLPFPEVDLVNFFNSHPKLQKFEIHGAMFASLCQKNSLANVNSNFVIPSLEEVSVIVRSPLNAEQKLNTLESLVMHSPKLQRMVIRVSQMKNCNEAADDFFEEVCKFQFMNQRIVCIE